MKRLALIGLLQLVAAACMAYPLDGYPETGIRRLDYYQLVQEGTLSGRQLPPGARFELATIEPRHPALASLDDAQADELYQEKILSFLGKDKDRYGIAILDLSNPDEPVFAQHKPLYKTNVGSVGKIVAATALFQELARLHPDDIAAREAVLRNTRVIADRFVEWDSHEVHIWNVEERRLRYRPLRVGDEGSLWEYLDWTLSASSNAAASMVLREIILMRHFGAEYPVSEERVREFLDSAKASQLRELMLAAMANAMESNGLDTEYLRQGSFFTHYGKNRLGGIRSHGTPRELMKLLLRIERGTLVDEFSSREMKRLLYMTQKRIRYASHPALTESAVYFKTGSLYSCKPEPGFTCKKYMGNKRNTLASVAIVETGKPGTDLHYLVVVISNVLRVNSAVAHQTLAMRIHRMIEARHAVPVEMESLEEPGALHDLQEPLKDAVSDGGEAGVPAPEPPDSN